MNREVSSLERAAWWLRSAIRRTANEAFGAEIVREQVAGLTIYAEALDDPLAGVRAALLARNVAVAELWCYAEAARGAGRSWDEVAEALGIEASDDSEPRGRAGLSAPHRGPAAAGGRATAELAARGALEVCDVRPARSRLRPVRVAPRRRRGRPRGHVRPPSRRARSLPCVGVGEGCSVDRAISILDQTSRPGEVVTS